MLKCSINLVNSLVIKSLGSSFLFLSALNKMMGFQNISFFFSSFTISFENSSQDFYEDFMCLGSGFRF